VLGFAMFGSIIFVPLYLQIVKGESPTKSGLLMLPMMVGIIATSIISGRMISKQGRYKWYPVFGTAVMAAGLLLFTQLAVNTPLWQAFIYMLLVGIGLGAAMQPLVLAVQNSLELKDMGSGTAASTFFRSLGGAVGVATLGAVLSNKLTSLNTGGGPTISINDPASIKALPAAAQAQIHSLFTDALHPIFLVAGLVTVIAIVLSIVLPNGELKGAGAAPRDASAKPVDGEGLPPLVDEDDELAAAEMEAQAASMI